MDYKEKLEAEMFERQSGAADMYLYRNTPRQNQIVEQIDPPEGGEE
jgi:hypothetical protein